MDGATLLMGLGIFLARICDVSIGTVRTIVTVQGRTVVAFCLGFAELVIWISVVGTVVNQIQDKPVLIVFYALGFSTGTVLGILVERQLAFGHIVLRIITSRRGEKLAHDLRKMGQAVTSFMGEGMYGPVKELYVVCRRRDLKRILLVVRQIDPDAFYITEQAGDVSKLMRPIHPPAAGWLSVLKKK